MLLDLLADNIPWLIVVALFYFILRRFVQRKPGWRKDHTAWWAWYREYLRSDEWKDLRARKLAEVGYRCESCGRVSHQLQAHHLHYRTVGHEDLQDLSCLCYPCHCAIHGRIL